MNFFEELFLKTGYRQDFIADKLDIKKRTLQNWLKLENIEYSFLNTYYKTNIDLESDL
jgi:hypothetical protein